MRTLGEGVAERKEEAERRPGSEDVLLALFTPQVGRALLCVGAEEVEAGEWYPQSALILTTWHTYAVGAVVALVHTLLSHHLLGNCPVGAPQETVRLGSAPPPSLT